MIDDLGERENFEKFKKEHEDKSLEELLDELKESIKKRNELENKKESKYELSIKSLENGKHQVCIQGTGRDILVALRELIGDIIHEANAPVELVREVVNDALDQLEED
jgi:hypothetical protein